MKDVSQELCNWAILRCSWEVCVFRNEQAWKEVHISRGFLSEEAQENA